MDETLNDLNEQTLPTNAAPDQAPPTNVALGNEDVILDLPAQYSSGNAGFFNRQNESVPTAVTVGPDGALYASELSALPYPEGYARVIRVSNPDGDASYDGETPGGKNQIYASGFEQINGLTFDDDGALYVLEYVNGSDIYDPTQVVEDLPPSQLIRVDPDGTRSQISGGELRFGNYLFAHEGKVYAAINNGGVDQGQVLAYEQNGETGEWSHQVVADNLKNPRGMDIGPDGNLYVLESGEGTPADDPNVEDALSVQFIPGLVSQRAGYTAAITQIDLANGGQERVYEGLPSTIEYNPNTGEDRIISIGSNGMAIGKDGTVWIASGGGLSEATAEELGEFGDGLRGVLKLDGLFGEDPSQATWTPTFDAVKYAGENGPDGATTLFNTQSNLNDIEIGPDGNLYAVDAARNVMYGISPDGENVASVSVLQKTPPVLTPPQYGLVTQAGGDPNADYGVEISDRTFKGENELPDTPGRQIALANEPIAPEDGTMNALGEGQPPTELESLDGGQITADRPTPGNPMLEPQASADGLPAPDANAGEGIDLPDNSEVLVATTGDIPTEVPGFDPTMSTAEGDMDGESTPPQGFLTQESASGNNEPPLRGEDATIGGILGNEQPAANNLDPVSAGQITADRPTPGNPMLESQAPADGLPAADSSVGEGVDLPDNASATTIPDGAPTEVPGFDPTMPPPDGFDPTMPPPDGFDPNDFDPLNPGLIPGVEQSVLIPGPVDPIAPVITEGNPFAEYFDPFFGVYSPAQGDEPILPNGEEGYKVNNLFVFGDRLTENGGEFGKNSVAESTGANPPFDEGPYSETGNFTDGNNWTTNLASILGVENYEAQDTNFSYLDATARELFNPIDPFGEATELNTFAGQIDTFKGNYGTFSADDLVVVNFGGNDLTLPPAEGVAPEEAAQQSIQATVDGIADLQELGAENFLVGLVPPVELAPIFSDPEFLGILGVEPGFFEPVVEGYNQGLTAALEAYELESGANIEILDTNGLFDAIGTEPGAYGFVNVDEPVLSSKTPVTGEPLAYNDAIVGEDPAVQHATLFIDPYFHPTALGHSIVAETARNGLLGLGEFAESTSEATAMTDVNDLGQDTLLAPSEDGMQIQADGVTGENMTVSVSVPGDYLEQMQSLFPNLVDGQTVEIANIDLLFDLDGGENLGSGTNLEGGNTITLELSAQDEFTGAMMGSMEASSMV